MSSTPSKARIAGIVENSIVDGKGLRLAVFMQGCLHHCPGCHNPETWPISGGEMIDLDSILDKVRDNPLCAGITLTGGEPVLQPEACAYLARKTKEMGKNVWLYTGYYYKDLKNDPCVSENLLPYVDIVVDGPFKESLKTLDKAWVGSANQTVHVLRH